MWLEIIVSVVLIGYAIHTTYRGMRLLKNQEIVVGMQPDGKVYSHLSPSDKRLFGVGYIIVGVLYLVTTALAFMGAAPAALYTIGWILLAVGSCLAQPCCVADPPNRPKPMKFPKCRPSSHDIATARVVDFDLISAHTL